MPSVFTARALVALYFLSLFLCELCADLRVICTFYLLDYGQDNEVFEEIRRVVERDRFTNNNVSSDTDTADSDTEDVEYESSFFRGGN